MFGSILILLALPLLSRPVDARPDGFDKSNFKTMAPEQVLARLATAGNIKIKDPGHTLLDKWHLKWCNGGININAEGGRELSCSMRSHFEQVDLANLSLLQTSMQILFRSCGVYAFASDNDEGVSCGMLGRFFFRIGNIPAARAVWEHAPGCHAQDHGGHPVNGCIDAILGQSGDAGQTSDARVDWSSDVNYMNAYASDPQELIKLASDACSKENDYAACQLLKSKGGNVDLGSVAAYDNRRIQQNENAEAAADRAAEINAQERRERANALIGALQALPGANDPNAIVDTANRQAANMVALGAANDAARAQAATRRAEQQRQEQQAEQQSQQEVQQAQQTAPIASSQRVPDLPAGCITITESDPGEANFGAWIFTNNCGARVSVVVTAPPDPQLTGNRYDFYQSDSLAVGQSLRGPQANQRYKYFACPSPFAPYDSSSSAGNIVNPSFETTKTVCLEVDASGDILAH